MATTRQDPLGLLALARSMESKGAEKSSAAAPQLETARMSNDVPGVCPVCNTRMTRIMAKDVPVYWCQMHSVVLPTED